MYRKWVAIVALILTILGHTVAGAAVSPGTPGPVKGAATDAEQVKGAPSKGVTAQVGTMSYTAGDSIAEPDEEFVTDSHTALDRYTFRSGGPLVFPVRIDRYFGPVDGSGHLLHPENVEGQSALLTLRVWDVDQNSSGPGYNPEVDKVYVNGQQVGTLTGADSQWSTFTVSVPVSQLKFPDLVGGTVSPADNWIEVHIDTANVGNCECWAVQVDWARMVIKGIRPAVLVHGFMSDASTWSPWETGFAPSAGLPVYTFSFANNHGSWLAHASELAGHIDTAKQMFGVEKLNIVGHSKGGLDSRAMLALTGRTDIKQLVMMGTPNGGSPLANIALAAGIVTGTGAIVSHIANPALTELTPAYMAVGNMMVGQNPATQYYTIAGNWSDGFLIDGNPLIWGQDDGVVAVTSVETLGYTTNLGHSTSFHTAMTAGAAEWGYAQGPVVTTFGMGAPVALTAAAGPPNLSHLSAHTVPIGDTGTHEIIAEAGVPTTMGILWGGGSMALAVTSPSGVTLTENSGGVTITTNTDALTGLNYSLYRVEAPEGGAYQLTINHAESWPMDYVVVAAVEAPPAMSAAMRAGAVAAGADAIVEATLDWNGQTPAPVAAEARIRRPDGTVDTISLADDGSGEDAAAGDGTYTGAYTPAAEGFHFVVATATGTAPGSSLQRLAFTGFAATGMSDSLGTVTGHRGVDTNGDGFYDFLEVDVSTQITTPGGYSLPARLVDASGQTVAATGATVNLSAGPGTVQLRFDGGMLGDSGFTGDLHLVDVALIRSDGAIADFRSGPWTLSGYNANQFRKQPMRVLPGITDQGVDTNGNGKYDRLDVTIPVQVTTAGTYAVNARLVDSSGGEIEWKGRNVYLSSTTSVTLSYTGLTIGEHGMNGPFHVRDFSLYLQSTGKGINIYNLHTTAAYAVSQFEGAVGDTEPPVWPAGSALTVSGLTGHSLTLNWTPATDNVGVARYTIYQNGAPLGFVDGSVHFTEVTGLDNYTSYGFKVEAEDAAGNATTTGPSASATTGGPSVVFLPPLDAGTPANHPADQVLPIRFQWLVNGDPTLDTSVSIRVRDGAGRLITGYSYGSGITYDPATGEYLQPFNPAQYGQGPGGQLRIQVYIGGRLKATAYVNLQ